MLDEELEGLVFILPSFSLALVQYFLPIFLFLWECSVDVTVYWKYVTLKGFHGGSQCEEIA